MTTLQIFPYVLTAIGQWSISDMVMAGIFDQMSSEGKVEHLFYDGSIRDIAGWLDFIKRPGNHIIIVADMAAQTEARAYRLVEQRGRRRGLGASLLYWKISEGSLGGGAGLLAAVRFPAYPLGVDRKRLRGRSSFWKRYAGGLSWAPYRSCAA